MTLILTFLRPFIPYLLGLALVASVVTGAYVKGRSDVKSQWAASVAAANTAALQKQLTTDHNVRTADAIRAEKAEAALTAYKAKATADEKALQHPGRECFGAADTRRVQRLFER